MRGAGAGEKSRRAGDMESHRSSSHQQQHPRATARRPPSPALHRTALPLPLPLQDQDQPVKAARSSRLAASLPAHSLAALKQSSAACTPRRSGVPCYLSILSILCIRVAYREPKHRLSSRLAAPAHRCLDSATSCCRPALHASHGAQWERPHGG
ncbi:hypothetical protein IQ07DRAFT_304963 [Pyrenochaeta sp. DS3sAY3a]|nr:hypothetical protein IQ07DRAFT_304963 [Pyrenochaeta sp. DS3sAY3a]